MIIEVILMKFKPIHSCIRVVNLEKSVDFYKNAFGFIETRRKDLSLIHI